MADGRPTGSIKKRQHNAAAWVFHPDQKNRKQKCTWFWDYGRSQPKSSTGPPGRVWVLKQPVVLAPFVCSISSGVNTRAPLRLNTRFDMTCSFLCRKVH